MSSTWSSTKKRAGGSPDEPAKTSGDRLRPLSRIAAERRGGQLGRGLARCPAGPEAQRQGPGGHARDEAPRGAARQPLKRLREGRRLAEPERRLRAGAGLRPLEA